MSSSVNNDQLTRVELDRYRSRIPQQLWDILIPADEANSGEFAISIKRLRIREQERDYVMTIQRKFGITVRPNESVKEAMTRVRLKLIQDSSVGDQPGEIGGLPRDPLE
jgi:hypothetical protein